MSEPTMPAATTPLLSLDDVDAELWPRNRA